jgi:hypothetical protein
VDERREEKGIVKWKIVCYLLDHGIPLHSSEGPVIAVLTSAPFILAPTPLIPVPTALVPAAMPRVLLTVLIGLNVTTRVSCR